MTTTSVTGTQPVLATPRPSWDGAVWISEISDEAIPAGRIGLAGADGFATARFLVRRGRAPRGFVELPVRSDPATGECSVDGAELASRAALLPVPAAPGGTTRPGISVVLCTRDRPEQLCVALDSLLRLDYPEFEVLVVDNGPESGATRRAVELIRDERLRIVDAPRPGLAKARNVGLRHARYDIVAFTDDDVVVDGAWLRGIADGFAGRPEIACVTGMVPSVELTSVCQAYFDRRVTWARNCVREEFAVTDRRPSEPLFPFQVGRFGTGANFALRRPAAFRLGGFDEGFGVGSPTGGGEDIEMFVRVLLSGATLVYEPSAIVWHRHRTEINALTKQIRDYGTGLGAWLTQLALHPGTAVMIVRRALGGLRHVRRMTRVAVPGAESLPGNLGRIERTAILAGPLALARARFGGARRRPLAGPPVPGPSKPVDSKPVDSKPVDGAWR